MLNYYHIWAPLSSTCEGRTAFGRQAGLDFVLFGITFRKQIGFDLTRQLQQIVFMVAGKYLSNLVLNQLKIASLGYNGLVYGDDTEDKIALTDPVDSGIGQGTDKDMEK